VDSRGFAQAKLLYFHIYGCMLSIVGTTYFLVKNMNFYVKVGIIVKLDIFYLKLYLHALKKGPCFTEERVV